MAVTLGIYYLVPWIRWDRGPYLPDQAVLIDFPVAALLLLLPRDLAAGVLLHHRPAGARRARSVPGHLHRRPRLVRLYLPADGVDRSDDRGRALLAGRPQSAPQARQGALVLRDALAQERHASHLAPDRHRHRRRLGLLFRRRADASSAARQLRRAAPRLSLHRHLHRHHLCAWRHRPRAGLRLYVPLAAHSGRDVR